MNQHSDHSFDDPFDPSALLKWYVEMGADECIGDDPIDRYAASQEMLARKQAAQTQAVHAPSSPTPSRPASAPQQEVKATDEMVHTAVEAARKATTVEELRQAVLAY